MPRSRRPPRPPSSLTSVRPEFDEPPTGRSNQTLALYQTMLGRFDDLNDAERTDLVELMSLFADASPSDRQLLMTLGRRFGKG